VEDLEILTEGFQTWGKGPKILKVRIRKVSKSGEWEENFQISRGWPGNSAEGEKTLT
jgi:hypothetical protein